jgi:tRNA threonylcarbamoyl adenosine modification protein YeaZ
MADPLILSFDTSGPHCAVAVMRGEAVLAARVEAMAKGQAERLMPMIEAALAEAEVGVAEIDAIGVGVGPGNFTGIRISVAAARGLALALGVPAVGVSTLEALALGTGGCVLATVDARRGQVYAQVFVEGVADAAPVQAALEDVPTVAGPCRVIGHEAEAIAARIGGVAAAPASPLADAIARIAAARMGQADLPRPAPLYLRAADAAPSKEAGPVMLP